MEDGTIAFNNAVALLEHSNELYQAMLSFLSNCCINKALTLQPPPQYMWNIFRSFCIHQKWRRNQNHHLLLSWLDEPLSFIQKEFISAIGLPVYKNHILLPPKETVSIDLTLVKPHTIKTASFQKPPASEVSLTSHMLKVAKLYQELEQSLIPPFEEVNADDTTDKSLSRASEQPVTQSKAPTDLKTKKNKIPSFSQPKSPHKVRATLPKKQVAQTQHAEVKVATADATKSLEASELVEEQGNQPSTAEAKKSDIERLKTSDVDSENSKLCWIIPFVHKKPEKIIEVEEDVKDHYMEIPTVEQLLDEVDKQIKVVQETSENADSDDTQGNEVSHSDHTFLDHNAFADRLSLLDHLDHIYAEVNSLHSKLDTMESSIIYKVSDGIKSTLPALVTTALQEQLSGLLSDTLRYCLSLIIQESLQTYIQASFKKFAEKQTKLNKRVVKHLNRQFNIFYVTQSDRFARLETELYKTLKSDMGKSVTKVWYERMIINDTAEGEKNKKAKDPNPDATQGEPQSAEPLVESQEEQPAGLNIVNKESDPPASGAKINEGKELVVHKSEDKKSEGIISVEDDSDEDYKQPLSKRFKIITPIPNIPNPTPMNTFVPEYPLKPKEQQKSIQEFIDQLFKTTSLRFSPTPSRELKPPRDSSKGKEVAIIEEPGNKLVKYQEEQEEYNNQIREMKRLKDLKAEQEKSEHELRKLFNLATLKAQAHKWTEHEAKKAKMMKEYKNHISFRADTLPVTKIRYAVNSRKEATIKITRGDNPLNLVVHPNFRLKTLGFSEWPKVHALASKKSETSNNILLQSLRAKFQWVINQAKRLGIPPPPELATFGLTAEEKKGRGLSYLRSVVINEPESGIFFMNGNTNIGFQRKSEFHLTPTDELIRLQNQIKVDSEIAREMFSKMNYVIEARSDYIKAKEIVEKNLDNMSAVQISSLVKLIHQSSLLVQREPEKIVGMEEDAKDHSMEISIVKQLLDEVDKQIKVVQETSESPYDTESEIKIVKSYFTSEIPKLQDQIMHDSDESADYESMPEDDLRSVLGFEDAESNDTQGNKVSHSDHTFPDHNASADQSSIIHQVLDGIKSTLPALVTTDLQEQLPKLLSNTLRDCLPSIIQESLQTYIQASSKKFARLETELSKTLKSEMGKSVTKLVKSVIINDTAEGEKNKKAKDPNPAATQGEPQSAEPLVESQEEQPADLNIVNKESAPPASDAKINEGKELVVYKSKDKKSKGIISVEDDSDEDYKQPISKRFKIMTLIPDIPNPTPLNTFVPEHLLKPKEQQKDSSKGKAVAIIEEPGDKLVKYQEEEGSNPKMPKLNFFIALEGPLSQKEHNNQIKEMKRLKDLKAEQENSEHELRKADTLPFTKISYVVNSRKEVTMKFTRDNNPLNLVVRLNFRLKTLAFSEWLEEKRLRIPPPPKLATFGLAVEEKKRKRIEFIKEVFVIENVRVDGMDRNVIPPPESMPIQGVVINEPELLIFFMNGNTNIGFHRGSEFHLTPTAELIRLQNQINVDLEIAREMFTKMNYVIEARSNCIKARKEYAEVLRRVRGDNNLTILSPFEKEQAELKDCSLEKAGNLSVYGRINIGLS
nr:hypothetical protein [Tanacetum cinerariifolium]